ncbi:MAG: RND transporter, partial [Rhodocyclales bacterium CG17_big_fil_post_rev_8_21_14_2_50_68_7]
MIVALVKRLERLFFGHRIATLAVLAAFTVAMGYFASQLRMSAGFEKQLPKGHEYVQTFSQYRDQLFGANRVVVVVHNRKGDIWNTGSLRKLSEVTQAVMFMPGIDRRTVTSLWTPNTRVLEITEEGFHAEDVIGGDITPDGLTPEKIERIRGKVLVGGYVGNLVANDGSGAMVTADLLEEDPKTRRRLDTLELGRRLEQEVRKKYETSEFDIQIIGFAKQISDIADGAKSVAQFFLLAFL